MCGAVIPQGILCGTCDRPRRPKAANAPAERVTTAPVQAQRAPTPAATPSTSRPVESQQSRPQSSSPSSSGSAAHAIESFPKAPILTFPVETASLAITSIVDLLVAADVPAVLLGTDRAVKFVTESAKHLFADCSNVSAIEAAAGIRVTDLTSPASLSVRIQDRGFLYSLVPLSGGAGGAVLVFRYADASMQAHAAFFSYVRETVIDPLRSLHDSVGALASQQTPVHPVLTDATATLEQVLTSLELAPEVRDRGAKTKDAPTVSEVVHRVAKHYEPYAELKGIRLQVDAHDLTERFRDHERLAASLGILVDNSLAYVPAGGQIVIGLRWMEHKGKPLLLFFVMDNGPIVPDELRHAIFEPDFVWNAAEPRRTGRGLFKAREFAVAHSGSVWVESRTGRACTFFLRVRPDGYES